MSSICSSPCLPLSQSFYCGWDHHNGTGSMHFDFMNLLDGALAEFYAQMKCLDLPLASYPANATPAQIDSVNAANQAMINARLASTTERGALNDATLFTASDFGRALVPNGDGTDHAWGGNQIILGGAVNGGDLYGQYPAMLRKADNETLSADLYGNGVFVPTLAVDQYMQRLGKWLLVGTGGSGWLSGAGQSTPEWNQILPNWESIKGWNNYLNNVMI